MYTHMHVDWLTFTSLLSLNCTTFLGLELVGKSSGSPLTWGISISIDDMVVSLVLFKFTLSKKKLWKSIQHKHVSSVVAELQWCERWVKVFFLVIYKILEVPFSCVPFVFLADQTWWNYIKQIWQRLVLGLDSSRSQIQQTDWKRFLLQVSYVHTNLSAKQY